MILYNGVHTIFTNDIESIQFMYYNSDENVTCRLR